MQPRAIVVGKRIFRHERVAAKPLRIVSGPRASQTEARWQKFFKPEERILVPSGRVLLGDPQGDADEKPNRWVTVTKPFFLSRSLVSVEQFSAFLAEGIEVQGARLLRGITEKIIPITSGETESALWQRAAEIAGQERYDRLEIIRKAMGELPDFESNQDKDNPVCGVLWALARNFCQAVGGDLPTAVQWHRAARGESGQEPFGNPPETAVIYDNQTDDYRGVRKVRGEFDQKRAGWLGIRDLSGNLWEWTKDRFDPKFYSRIEDGESDPHLPLTDPASQLAERAGGSWGGGLGDARAANRRRGHPGDSGVLVGFRVAWPQDS